MKITRRTSIIVETERKIIVRPEAGGASLSCPQCGGKMFAARLVAGFFDLEDRAFDRFVESGKIHFLKTPGDETYLCPRSFREILKDILS